MVWVGLVWFATAVPSLRAVIFHATADLAHNTTAPTGPLADSGWQWIGDWGGFPGTAIGPHHFVAASHINGAVGLPFVLHGVSYTTVAAYEDPAGDLRILEVSEAMPAWAPLYRASNEVGRNLIVFGRGLTRGEEVRDSATDSLRGWMWGSSDGILRWGSNTVKSVVDGGPSWGKLLYATFEAEGGPEEAHLALGDSSGPVFVNDGLGWKLAGIAATVDGSFNTTNSGPGFSAAIFDARGLYVGSAGSWTLVSGPTPRPSGFYATRVYDRLSWIDGVVPPPPVEPGVDVPVLPSGAALFFAALLFGGGALALKSRRKPARPGS